MRYGLFLVLFIVQSSWASVSKELTLKGFDYNKSRLSEVALKDGKPHVLLFFSTNCPCSNSHIEHSKELAKLFPKIQFVGVHSNQNENQESGSKYFSKQKLPFPIIRDDGAFIADKFGALKTPHAFVISKNGETLYAGPLTDSRSISTAKRFYLKDYLASISTGKSFEPIKKRPLGCYIYRGSKKQ